MRRSKVILAALAALMMMAMLSAPAMAQGYPNSGYPNSGYPNYYGDDCDWDGC
jgi:hypothetical protein